MKKAIIIVTLIVFSATCFQANLSAVNIKPDSNKGALSQLTITVKSKNQTSMKSEFNTLNKGTLFQSEKETYYFLPELYSVIYSGNPDNTASGNLTSIQSERSASLIQKKGRFSIYQSGLKVQDSKMTCQTVLANTLYPVVLNSRTGNLGIVTGNVIVKLKDIEQADEIAAEFNLNLKKAYSHLSTAFYLPSSDQDMLQLTEELGNDSRVKRATIEVLEYIQEAR